MSVGKGPCPTPNYDPESDAHLPDETKSPIPGHAALHEGLVAGLVPCKGGIERELGAEVADPVDDEPLVGEVLHPLEDVTDHAPAAALRPGTPCAVRHSICPRNSALDKSNVAVLTG